jgi:ABC-type branched-subunit amino acid transport system substrate-binding protein
MGRNRPSFSVSMIAGVMLAIVSSISFAKESVSLLFVGGDGDAYRGFVQALAEANRQGRFLGFEFTHRRIAIDGKAAPPGDGAEKVAALFTAVSPETFIAMARTHAGLPVFNLTSRDDALRELCLPNAFHAPPSERMLADAVAQWREAGNTDGDVSARVWDTGFRRYAAAQLSGRFEQGQGRAMTDEAYAGWAATKLYAEAVMSQKSADAATMLEALHADTAFDGQKGVSMQFRDSGQLNQMILLVQDGKVVGEAPVRGLHQAYELETLGFTGCKEQ